MRLILLLFQIPLSIAILLSSVSAFCDVLQVEITGLDKENLVENVKAHIGTDWISSSTMKTERKRAGFRADAEIKAARALRPFGYYFPEISSEITHPDEKTWVLKLNIRPGDAIRIRNLDIEVIGEGSQQDRIIDWRKNWPLKSGERLMQVVWEEQKQLLLDIAEEQGFLSAKYERSSIELDLDDNIADLVLILDTGPRAVMGEIFYDQDIVRTSVLESLPRFNKGDYYSVWLVDRLRTDLWRTGYFDEINVVEQRQLDQDPMRVDFEVTLKERNKHSHQGTIGYGTDSQFRLQYRWQHHLLSKRGDTLGVALGWQQQNEELLLSGEYRLPRRTRSNQYWLIGSTLKSEVQDVRLTAQNSDDQYRLYSGRVEDFTIRTGKAKLRDISRSQEQIIETMYVEFLRSKSSLGEYSTDPGQLSGSGDVLISSDEIFEDNDSISLGMGWDWPVIQGKRFNTSGHHERAWWFTANDAWGSEREFTQIYLNSRWNFVFSERWKILLRGEVGYTDAAVHEFEREVDGDVLGLSVTDLPVRYRFKAGGSRSVRGYGFEDLSTNNIGSNHILTASAEVEYQFRQDWSLAAFYDVGNAFNHWSETDLKTGIGVGLRWYTIAGAIRVDVAQAQDIEGKPWQFHLTIGTPLL